MPRIFDNIEEKLLDSLKSSLKDAQRADFCVGYFHLRGWKLIHDEIEQFSGNNGSCCRLLVGMQRLAQDERRQLFALGNKPTRINSAEVNRLRKQVAEDFYQQLVMGIPSNEDEIGLQKLKKQLQSKKLVVKLYLRHSLHAKLYLIPQNHVNLPAIAFLGSSNLTFPGLSAQGELNVDILDHDATRKLQSWFDERWNDNFCVDISEKLAEIIDQSWAREELIPPYYIYLKMAYHLCQEARDGLSQYRVPPEFKLFDFQEAAVRVAAHHVNRRGGVMVGDVVGLGKTLVGTAIAKICEEDFGFSTLIICPKNLVPMWEEYKDNYGLRGKVMSISRVIQELPNVPARFRLILIDESHNLRNRQGQRYAAIKEYIEQSDSKCILLTATPYNKSYLDLSAQLRLFIPEDRDLGIKPEIFIRELGGEMVFNRNYPQTSARTLAGFEKGEYSEDWQQLMSRYMVRRTRSFIKENYAKTDPENDRKYLEFADGTRSYFPTRIPKTARFTVGNAENDPYAQLYSDRVVDVINALFLPRYGLGNYVRDPLRLVPTPEEQQILKGLSRAGQRLLGFCRTNLFKRLESSGEAFIKSLERHIIRNYIYLYAIDEGQLIPIGTQEAEFLDTRNNDEDIDSLSSLAQDMETQEEDSTEDDEFNLIGALAKQEAQYKQKAGEIYQLYRKKYQKRFKWLRSTLFSPQLRENLLMDALSLMAVLNQWGEWKAENDQKLTRLLELLTQDHPHDKILIFTQFADTAYYLEKGLKNAQIQGVGVVTGNSKDPTAIAHRFSPKSNQKQIEEELRILIATDVLSEGQNLQDCAIIVNYDLPWAIIRLIQRAGRVDRIGQSAETILCYSFFPAEGVERLINLRERLINRLQENAEVVGTDEKFFEGNDHQVIVNLYTEKSGIIDEEEEGEVDLISEALQIWKNATDANPELAKKIENLPPVVYSTRYHHPTPEDPEGVMIYVRTAEGTDALGWVDKNGKSVTQSQMRILRMARCNLNTPPKKRHPEHHNLVEKGTKDLIEYSKKSGGHLGSPRSARAKTYERLKHYMDDIRQRMPLLTQGKDWEALAQAVETIYQYPLKESAIIKLNRQLKSGITNEQLASMVISLMESDTLCIIHPEDQRQEGQIICSLGLFL